MKKKTVKRQTSCDSCANYVYDEDYECYTCDVNLDEDEMAHFLADTFYQCPYYRLGDESENRCDGTDGTWLWRR